MSTTTTVVEATQVPQPPTPTPIPTPEPTPTLAGIPEPGPVVVAYPPGLTADTVRIAVIADIETGGQADGLFADSWIGVLAWQRAVNEDPERLLGYTVEVELFDARLFNHAETLRQLCTGDFFALVGSQSLGDSENAELLGTEDCNIADFPGDIHSGRRAASPTTFLANPFLNDTRLAGPARYLVERYPEASQDLVLFYYDELNLSNETERLREMLVAEGMNVAFELPTTFDEGPSERVLTRWEEVDAQSLVWTADPGRLIDLLEALEDPPVFVLCELGCYSQAFIAEGGDAVEGVYAWIPHSPFDSPHAPVDLLRYRLRLSEVDPDQGWSEVSLQSWMAGRLFEEAFRRLISVEPVAPKREDLIGAAASIDSFTAEQILAPTAPGRGDPTPCFALMVVRDGRWVQEFPAPPRDKDCSEDNLFELVGTRTLGVATISAATSSEAPDEPALDGGSDLETPEEVPE